MRHINVRDDAGSSAGGTPLGLRLDILHIGKTILKVFSFFVIAVNGYSFTRIDWHHHLTLTLNDNFKASFPYGRQYTPSYAKFASSHLFVFSKGHS